MLEIQGQLIVSYRAYYDQLDLLKQLGQSWSARDTGDPPPDPLPPSGSDNKRHRTT